ncbi:MAG TPA: hypothetical protein VFR90_08370 [Methylibium sp.]|uniref:hypothetical protein n=1 Tax=Methylibium sp. TaxID=2067992 RepID=UPI002DC03709|nr:hypothetical protein [Methylibium sp.]HEU4459120.1 hypothetical protein [Methylibium sp.]
MKSLITTAALGLVGFSVYSSLRRQRQLQAPRGTKAEPLQRWEGEGGNVPAANTALKTARTDDLLAPGVQNDALQEPEASTSDRKPGISGSSVG